MNIETLHDHIKVFKHDVVDSGFLRDLNDYASSLPNAQNNIVNLREIATKVLSALDDLYDGDLPDALYALLPPDKGDKPFTDSPHNENLRNIVGNTETPQQQFFSQLNEHLNQLKNEIENNRTMVGDIEEFITPYLARDTEISTEEKVATISIVFKEGHTITSLNLFTKTLHKWNRTLPIYHQLLKGDSPKDIRIQEVQNGSIDVVVNLDVDVAINLMDLFRIGFKTYAAYLAYKKMLKPITDGYFNNQKLLALEKEREELMIENIGTAVQERVIEQHKEAKKNDAKIDKTSIQTKAKEVTGLVTEHVIRGNDIKFLALPEIEEETQKESETLANELRQHSRDARNNLRLLPLEEKQKLLDQYCSDPDEEEEEKTK